MADSTEDDGDTLLPLPIGPYRPTASASLTLVFEAGRPRAVQSFGLWAAGAVTIGRTPPNAAEDAVHLEGVRRIAVQVDDRRVSSTHAHLRALDEGWSLEDADSKNGTRLNGSKIGRALLQDGDVIETGQSFFVFRASGASVPSETAATSVPGLVTNLASLARQFGRLAALSRSSLPILILGETGTGKELVAQAVHTLSERTGPLRAVNCGAMARTLIESEFFGHRKGAFSGASEDRPGLVRSANKGTLFLDEIGDLPADAQAALLRVLQESEVLPVGAVQPVPVDVRVVAATHRNLESMVDQGRFRADLLARLAGFVVTIPRLAERREDMGIIVRRLVERHTPELVERLTFSSDAIRVLLTSPWRTNIRELDNLLRKVLTLAKGGFIAKDGVIGIEDLGRSSPMPADGDTVLRERDEGPTDGQKAQLVRLLAVHSGNISAVAADLNTSRSQVHRLCQRFGVTLQDYRSRA